MSDTETVTPEVEVVPDAPTEIPVDAPVEVEPEPAVEVDASAETVVDPAVEVVPDTTEVTKTAPEDTETKAGGADRNRGNAERLRAYWTRGPGGAKIRWNTPGDWTRCRSQLSKYLGARAAGYCQLRHKEMTGVYAGDRRNKSDDPSALESKADARTDTTNPEPTGCMVALYPSMDVADDLAEIGAAAKTPEDWTDLHVTLAFLGDAADVDADALVELVEAFAADHGDVDADIAGLGTFTIEDDRDAWVALVDAPSLPALRQDLVGRLKAGGFPVRENHGFTAHITLAYLDEDEAPPTSKLAVTIPCRFGLISVAHGPDVWDLPLKADDEGAQGD